MMAHFGRIPAFHAERKTNPHLRLVRQPLTDFLGAHLPDTVSLFHKKSLRNTQRGADAGVSVYSLHEGPVCIRVCHALKGYLLSSF